MTASNGSMPGSKSLVFHSIEDLRSMAKASRATIYAAIKSGRLKAVKRGRRTLVEDSDYKDWVSSWPRLSGGEAA